MRRETAKAVGDTLPWIKSDTTGGATNAAMIAFTILRERDRRVGHAGIWLGGPDIRP